jgi:hypothetical protein
MVRKHTLRLSRTFRKPNGARMTSYYLDYEDKEQSMLRPGNIVYSRRGSRIK